MGAIDQILFATQSERFRQIEDLVKRFLDDCKKNKIDCEDVFSVIRFYADEKDIPLEIMRYPFEDKELWAFTFLKKGTIFICVNSGLSLCKQFFAAAHELYHIYCFGEDTDQNIIRNGSLLKAENADGGSDDQEELEANAFAGLLLMPETAVCQQIDALGTDGRDVTQDDVLRMADIFAIPYKACALRLYECGVITRKKAIELYEIDRKTDTSETAPPRKVVFGTLLENYRFNVEHGFLTESREESDKKYFASLKERYGLDVGDV